MNEKEPSLMQMIRAPFLSSIISPLIAGTILCVKINGSLNILGFILVLITGIALHIATNVYNDIYDTIQGTDMVNEQRNEFSGGSGILQAYPSYMGKMYFIARISLVIALFSTIGLMFFINKSLWIYLWGLYLISAFFSKYYTAPPFKLAYRGMGEISILISFGPMAIFLASIGQNILFNNHIFMLMPLCGLSTLSVLLIGQMIDIDADRKGGKFGVALRLGSLTTSFLYVFTQIAVIGCVLCLFIFLPGNTLPILLSLIPYIIFFPITGFSIVKYHNNMKELKKVAKKTVQIHMLFSLLLSVSLIIYLFI